MKLWLDAQSAPPTDEWKWAKTSQEAVPFIQSKQVTDANFFLNYGDGSDMTGLQVIRFILILAKNGRIPRIKWSVRGGLDQAEVKKAPLVLAEADKFWTATERKGRK